MGRAILVTSNLKRPKRMDTLACTGYSSTQQPNQHHHQTITQPDPLRIQSHTQLQQSITNPQRLSRVTSKSNDREPCKCHSSAEQGCQSERTSTLTIPDQGASLARCIPLETPPSKSKTNPQTPRPIQDHPGNIPSSLPT